MIDTIFLVPTFNHARLLPSFFSHLYRLSPKPSLTVFCENNSVDDTLKLIRGFKLPHELIRLWFRRDAAMVSESRYEVIAHIRQLLLTRARQLDPDYAVFLDDDVMPTDPLVIEKLTGHGLDVVGGPYLRFFPWGLYLASVWNDGGRLRAWDRPQEPLEEVVLTSGGCLCLSRRIIQDKRINFYPLLTDKSAEDFGYCRQARKYGYKVWLDGTVGLRHIIKESGKRVKAWSYNEKSEKYEPFYFP